MINLRAAEDENMKVMDSNVIDTIDFGGELVSQVGVRVSDHPLSNVIKMDTVKINTWYGAQQSLFNISMPVYENEILALIGPSGCGKSTYLRCMNRMNDLIKGFKIEGKIILDGIDIHDKNIDLPVLRRKVGMVFQQPNPFPMSIYDNIAFGVREINRHIGKSDLSDIVEHSLKQANLWNEVKSKLNNSGLSLSGGQQQRLCIARALAVRPELIMLDEPCASLDPISTAHIEELLMDLASHYTIVIVTHNLAQAQRISQRMAFFLNGRLLEHGRTDEMSVKPKMIETENYLHGRFG
jgi:phosphate transport system ATP-binding protein